MAARGARATRARACAIAVLASALVPCGARADDAAWSFDARSERHLDGAPLADFQDPHLWRVLRPRAGWNLGYLFEDASASRSEGGWTFSLVARERATVVASRDTLDLARLIDTGTAPVGDRAFHVRASGFGFGGGGVGVAREWIADPRWTLHAGVQALALARVIDRTIAGSASWNQADGTYAAQLWSPRADDKLRFPYEQGHARVGEAVLADLSVRWHGDVFSAGAALHDVGRMQWAGLPQQQETLQNHHAVRDVDGFVVYEPLIQGRDTQSTWRRWCVPVSEAEASVDTGAAGQWTLGTRYIPGGVFLPRVGARQVAGDWGLEERWNVHERRAELAVRRAGWRLAVGSDRLEASRRSLSWQIGWQSGG